MKRTTVFLALLILALVGATGPYAMAKGTAARADLTCVALTSAVTPGTGQGRWLLLDWFTYAEGGFRYYPTDSGLHAGWTLPQYDDSAWHDYTDVVWNYWWNVDFTRPSISELGERAMVGPQGFVNRATYLYRRLFDLPAAPSGYVLRTVELQAWSDNNAAFYINGEMVFLSTFPAGMSQPFTPRQLGLTSRGNVIAIQLANDDQVYNPIGVQFRLLLHYEAFPWMCISDIAPPAPQKEGTAVKVTVHAEDPRGISLVQFLVNSATDGSASGTWWNFANVSGYGQTAVDAVATLDWSRAPLGFPRTGTHLIAANSYYADGQISCYWQGDICRQRLYQWIASTVTPTLTPSLTPTPTATLEASLTPTPTETPEATLTPTSTPSPSVTPTASLSPTATPTLTPTATTTPTSTLTPVADMQLSVRDWHDPLTASWKQRYTITITNTGLATLSDLVVMDTIPTFTWPQLEESSPGAVHDGQGHVTWQIEPLVPGASAVRYLELYTSRALPHCSYMINRVSVTSAHMLTRTAESATVIIREGALPCGLRILP